jgi:cardiolipin synthase
LFAIGLVSFIAIVVILFLPVGKGPDLITATNPVPPAGSPPFLAAISNHMALPLDRGERPEILQNGDAFLKSFLKDIDGAQRSIDMMTYIWKDGRFSDVLLDHLERRQRAGVQVRLLVDAYGSIKASDSKFGELEKLGGKVMRFHSLMPLPWTIMRNTKRNHRRSIVVDGTIGYTGGIATDDVWLGDARDPSQWHDLMFRVNGSMARRLQGSFAELWAATTGELLQGARFYPEGPTGRSLPYVTLSTSPSPDLFEAGTFFMFSLLGARESIEMETPYFLPDAAVRKILVEKAKAGVAVTILVPNNHTDEKSVRWAGQRIYEELMAAGVRIFEYQPTFTHTKLLLEDGQWSVIGSANMDNRSRKLNDEIVLGIADPQFADSLDAIFKADLARSRRVQLQSWRRRGLVQRVLEYVSQAFVQQY